MFGPAYKKEMALEVFLRYLDAGINYLSEIREKLSFLNAKQLAHVLKLAYERGLISINKDNNTIFMRKRTYEVINFIEKYNFIEEIQKYEYDNTYDFDTELNNILMEIDFFKENYHNISDCIAKCMRYIYKDDYIFEVMKFRFYIYKSKTEKKQN